MWDRIIKNGILVTGTNSENADIYIKDGKIAKVAPASRDAAEDAREVIDASGKYVLPGLIDTHVHSRDGRIGAHHKEDFSYSTAAAAAGGITTIFEMPNCNPTIYSEENLNSLVEIVEPKALVDFGVWGLCLGDLNKDEIPKLDKGGVIGYKFFWGYAIDSNEYQLIYNYEPGMEGVIPPLDNGEVMKTFSKETVGSEAYNKVYSTLSVFRDNVELEYVYCIKQIVCNNRFNSCIDRGLTISFSIPDHP